MQDYAVDDGAVLTGRAASGTLFGAHVAYNLPDALPRRRLELTGSRGMIVAEDTMGQTPGGLREVSEMAEITVKIDYRFLSGLKNAADTEDFSIKNIEYKEKITAVLLAPSEKKEKIKNLLEGITSGGAKVVSERLIKC